MVATYKVDEQKAFDEFQKEMLDLKASNAQTAGAAPTPVAAAPAPEHK